MPYFPPDDFVETVYHCQGCGGWFKTIRNAVSCCVMHEPGTCCHFSELAVLAPFPATHSLNDVTLKMDRES